MSTPFIPGNRNSFILFLFIFDLFQLSVAQIEIHGACLDRCNEQRPQPGYTVSYRFDCQEAYDNEPARETCRESCEFCPEEVCDEYRYNGSSNLWHCPAPVWKGECSRTCEDNRPKGNRNSFSFECKDEFCTYFCNNCPGFVCTTNGDKIMIYCPPYEFPNSDCKKQCDEARTFNKRPISIKESRVEAFNFKCDQLYSASSTELTKCNDAFNTCPEFVKGTGGEYHCPAAELTVGTDCKKFCHDKRKSDGHSSSAFIFNCKKAVGSDWQDHCNKTCTDECGSYKYVCDPDNPEYFFCPQEDLMNEKPKAHPPTYKGECKKRCEMSRGGGYDKFDLKCNDPDRFQTKEEMHSCIEDYCRKHCPRDVCQPDGDKVIHCKEIARELKKEKKEKEEEIMKRRKEIREANEYHEERVREAAVRQRNLIIVCCCVLAVVALLVGSYIFVVERNRRKEMKRAFVPAQQQQGALPLPQQNSAISLASVPSGNVFPPART